MTDERSGTARPDTAGEGAGHQSAFREDAERVAREAQDIQARIDRLDAAAEDSEDAPTAMQAGAREYPAPPLPQRHLTKPGLEANLNPADRPDVTQFGAGSAVGRPAQPEEIAPAFVFLASPQMSSYITGEILPVIGGY